MSRPFTLLARSRPRVRLRPRAPASLLRCIGAAPNPGDGPLMERREDRELPNPPSPYRIWALTLPPFILVMTLASLGIFNYQKSESSITSSAMYALRTSPRAQAALGREIYYRDRWPWIWGSINTLHGHIDISFAVKGTKATGMMRFRSERKRRKDPFRTVEWSLKMEDGETLHLLEEGNDPLASASVVSEPGTATA